MYGDYVYKNFETAVNWVKGQNECHDHVGISNGNLASEVLRHPEVVAYVYMIQVFEICLGVLCKVNIFSK